MYEISEANAVDYLHSTGILAPQTPARARTLAWGVSNLVLRIEPGAGPDFVVKQSAKSFGPRRTGIAGSTGFGVKST
jgi:hypothetical protein